MRQRYWKTVTRTYTKKYRQRYWHKVVRKEKPVYRVQVSYEYIAEADVRKRDTPETVGETRAWVYTEDPGKWDPMELERELERMEDLPYFGLKYPGLRRVFNVESVRVDLDEVVGKLDVVQRYVSMYDVGKSRKMMEFGQATILGWLERADG